MRILALIVCCAVALYLGGATQSPTNPGEAPGFFLGLLHGFIILFSLVASIFTEHRIYAFPNSGGWYDLGYFIGALFFLDSGRLSAAQIAAIAREYEREREDDNEDDEAIAQTQR